MAFAKILQLGAPDYGTLKGTEGIVLHTPENNDPSVEAAVATARWQAGAGNTSGGSYHGILGYDDSRGPMSNPEAWVLVQTVLFGHIAGSISTRRDSIWAPERFPRLKELLSDAAYADPNAYLHALCLGGKAAWWKSKLSTEAGRAEVRGALVALAVWVRRLEVEYDYDALLNQHRFWQTNRSDADGGIANLDIQLQELVLDEYRARYVTPDATPTEPAPELSWGDKLKLRITELETTVAERDATITAQKRTIKSLRARIAAKDLNIDTAQQSLAAAKEA